MVRKSNPTSIPNQPIIEFKNATNDINAIKFAMIPAIRVRPVTAPFDAASNTEESDLIYEEKMLV